MRIFIGGARAINSLDELVTEKLKSIYDKNYTVLIGDADGADKAVQKYYMECKYPNVIVYVSNGRARNNLGNWPVESVLVPDGVRGFDFYTAKDEAMAESADCGFMIWDGDSRGTLNNVINLLKRDKETVVYFNPQKTIINIDSFDKLDKLISSCSDKANKFYKKQHQRPLYVHPQISLFEESVLTVQ